MTSFLERPLDAGPYRYLWLDGLTRRRTDVVGIFAHRAAEPTATG